MEKYKIAKKDVGKSLSIFYKCPFVEFEERLFVPPELVKNISLNYLRALSSRFKIMSRLDISERRKPQDGKIKFRMPDRKIELRVATLPTSGVDNEDVVMRILAASEPIPLDKMQMSERNLREFEQLLEKPYGIILCVGPTGSGKTTTLHSALGYIKRSGDKNLDRGGSGGDHPVRSASSSAPAENWV